LIQKFLSSEFLSKELLTNPIHRQGVMYDGIQLITVNWKLYNDINGQKLSDTFKLFVRILRGAHNALPFDTKAIQDCFGKCIN
jgi:hypothetical protein